MGIGYIPTAAIIGFMKEVEGENDRREIRRAIRMVHAIDQEFLAAQQKPTTPGVPKGD